MAEREPEAPRWLTLLRPAVALLRGIAVPQDAFRWAWGGGSVLAYLHNHRESKDVDIFISDPQLLGFLTPRLNDAALDLTDDYDEQSNYLKLRLPQGEIDYIVAPQLTRLPYRARHVDEMAVFIEHPVEIVAKKVFYRGAELAGRDVFDIALVAHHYLDDIAAERALFAHRRGEVLDRLSRADAVLRAQFAAIRTLDFRPSFEDCVQAVQRLIGEPST